MPAFQAEGRASYGQTCLFISLLRVPPLFGLYNRRLCSHGSRGSKSKSKVSTGLCFSEVSSWRVLGQPKKLIDLGFSVTPNRKSKRIFRPAQWMAIFSLCVSFPSVYVCVLISSYKDTQLHWMGTHPNKPLPFNRDTFKDSFSKQSHILESLVVRTLVYKF